MAQLRVALLGLGTMGRGMAGRLLGAKFPLTIYNRNAEKTRAFEEDGASVARSPREAAERADVVIGMVADDAASRAVWLGEYGALAGSAAAAVAIECSTLSVAWVMELAAAAAQRRCEFLDAPVTGTKPHAADGTMLFLVGGTSTALERARPVLAVMGRDAVHMGPTGSGAMMKLVNNFLCGVQAASLAEGMALVRASGLDAEKAEKVLLNGAPASPLIKTVFARVAAGELTPPNFEMRLMAKDIAYAHAEGVKRGVGMKTAEATLAVLQQAIAAGYGEKDFAAVLPALQKG